MNFSKKLGLCAFFFILFSGVLAQNSREFYSILPSVNNTRIDSLVQKCISDKVIPGCQVIAIHRGDLAYYKNFGYQFYDTLFPVNSATMYDVASMTKSLATTLAAMKLYDEGKFQETDSVGKFLIYTQGTPVGKLSIAELMTHTSGLVAFIPFYKQISPNGLWDTTLIHSKPSRAYSIVAAEGVYLRNDFPDTVLSRIVHRPLKEKKYVYSDLGFILLKEIVESISGSPIDIYLMQNFYSPLGLARTGFNPLVWTGVDNIAPTEEDHYFRHQVVRGYVHDQSAAVFGGVCGNAGLFSTAQDVAVILQMLMNGGFWNGKQYLSRKTVAKFVSTYSLHGCKRRGLGFDTPSYPAPNPVLPAAASNTTYGHQGFTGTVFWCDPQNDLIYVFLSNRVYPDANDNKLSKSKLRLLVHEEIYSGIRAIEK